MLGVELNVPAHGPGIVFGDDIGISTAFGNPGEYRGVGIRALIGPFLGVKLPVDALLRVQGLADGEAETVETATVTTVGTDRVTVKTIVLLPRHRKAQVAGLPTHALAGVEVVDPAFATDDFDPRAVAVGR